VSEPAPVQLADQRQARRGRSRRGLIAVALGVLFVVAAAATAAFIFVRGDEALVERGEPTEVSVAELRAFATSLDHPVYWAGEPGSRSLELTHDERGQVFVRYLGPGASAGDPRASFTTVATYPRPSAYRETLAAAERNGMVRADAPGGGLAVWSADRPTSVYLAYPGLDYLVEVYDPSARRARALALGGDVGPIR
jgi:hypothetical protein